MRPADQRAFFVYATVDFLKLLASITWRYIIAPVAVILLTAFIAAAVVIFFSKPADSAADCEKINISGEADYIVVYRQDDAWWLSAPGETSSKVHEGQILTMQDGAQLGVVALLDEKGKAHARAYNWHVHGSPKRFCLK